MGTEREVGGFGDMNEYDQNAMYKALQKWIKTVLKKRSSIPIFGVQLPYQYKNNKWNIETYKSLNRASKTKIQSGVRLQWYSYQKS